MNQANLYRSTQSRMVAGVMGGIAARFGWNANLLRIIFVIVSVMSAAFPGILIYLILWLIIPQQPQNMIQQAPNYNAAIRTVNEEHHLH